IQITNPNSSKDGELLISNSSMMWNVHQIFLPLFHFFSSLERLAVRIETWINKIDDDYQRRFFKNKP
ncbi:MAG: hypothetical protein WCE96_10190, partial [Nitrososphaeraceae archaeon]